MADSGPGAAVGGVMLLFYGFNSTQSLAAEASQKLTGRYTDDTMAYLIGGVAARVAGVLPALGGKKR